MLTLKRETGQAVILGGPNTVVVELTDAETLLLADCTDERMTPIIEKILSAHNLRKPVTIRNDGSWRMSIDAPRSLKILRAELVE